MYLKNPVLFIAFCLLTNLAFSQVDHEFASRSSGSLKEEDSTEIQALAGSEFLNFSRFFRPNDILNIFSEHE